jgi:hypothetical protein
MICSSCSENRLSLNVGKCNAVTIALKGNIPRYRVDHRMAFFKFNLFKMVKKR